MTYSNYILDILDLQKKKKTCVHFTRKVQYVSLYIRQTHYVSIVHLKHIMCPLHIVAHGPTTLYCGKIVDLRSLKHVLACMQLPLSYSG